MKRLGTLALAVILITGCNAIKPNVEETALLSKEIEKRIYAQAWPTESPKIAEATPVPTPSATPRPAEESQPENPVLTEEPAEIEQSIEPEPTPKLAPATPKTAGESEKTLLQPAESAEIIEWPYITCPPEPERPYITALEPPTYIPVPEPSEPLQEQPTPTPRPTPDVPADPVDPAPEPTEPPAAPTPEPTAKPAQSGYAQCSCGARLIPEEVLPHMKAHAMNGENHSYRAY